MKWSKIMHGIACLTGVFGGLALIGAWIAERNGTVLGLSQQHLYNDAISLMLIAIASNIGTLVHMHQEGQR